MFNNFVPPRISASINGAAFDIVGQTQAPQCFNSLEPYLRYHY
jgi:hypothetical protein